MGTVPRTVPKIRPTAFRRHMSDGAGDPDIRELEPRRVLAPSHSAASWPPIDITRSRRIDRAAAGLAAGSSISPQTRSIDAFCGLGLARLGNHDADGSDGDVGRFLRLGGLAIRSSRDAVVRAIEARTVSNQLEPMTRLTALAIFLGLCVASCSTPDAARKPAASHSPESAEKPVAAQAATSSGRGPGLENARAQADSPCSEKPSTPEKLQDPGKRQAIPAEFNKLFETGEFQLGYCPAEVRVSEKGTVDSVRLLRPENVDTRVESVIVREITSWRYRPATACERSVPSTTSVGFFHCPSKRR